VLPGRGLEHNARRQDLAPPQLPPLRLHDIPHTQHLLKRSGACRPAQSGQKHCGLRSGHQESLAVVAKMVLGHVSELKDNDALPPEAQ
jgi:hypothetical protein